MTLLELHPRFMRLTRTEEPPERWSWHEVETLAEADGVSFLDPKEYQESEGKRACTILCWFRGRQIPDDLNPGPGRWTPTGSGLQDLTLMPSVDCSKHGGWHGHVTEGKIA